MLQALFLCLLLIYYWYFYISKPEHVEKPTTVFNSNPTTSKFEFKSNQPNHFQFTINGNIVWEHTLPNDTFTFHNDKIIPIDPCYKALDGSFIPAKGLTLYEYLKENPETKKMLKFKENSSFTVQSGTVFYFKCFKGHIDKLEMCPSGTILVNNKCQTINLCTNQKNGTLIPHPNSSHFIVCSDGKEIVHKCQDGEIFHHDRCEPMQDLTHYCKHFDTPFNLNDETRLECHNKKPVFIKCKPGTKFINYDYCEPALCLGLPNDTKIPLPEEKADPFTFISGYMICRNNQIDEIVKCPKNWNETLTKGDNLLSLPMVFDTKTNSCSIPTFCENVFSDDPDIIVPVHEFTKHVKNWNLSNILDRNAGYVCENKTRKRKYIPADKRISKKFKLENACDDSSQVLPIYGNYKNYYDCSSKSVITCPDSTFFNGNTCVPEPKNAFKYNGWPLFQFEPLNSESWIKAWDYSKESQVICQSPEFKYIKLYNICSHPDCVNYAFLSQIPDLAILLPTQQRAKCKFDDNTKTLNKESVDFNYHFWNQKVSHGGEEKPCQIGQNLETGNFIWDSTIYSTCNINQPFVFCPSTLSNKIILVTGGYYACEPPNETSYEYDVVNEWLPFETNEIKRILPADWNDNPIHIRKNKASPFEVLPKDGLEILEGKRLNLLTTKKVKLEPRYRVTHPPNVAFKHIDSQNTTTITTNPDHGFLIKLQNFTERAMTFPRYLPQPFVEILNPFLYI